MRDSIYPAPCPDLRDSGAGSRKPSSEGFLLTGKAALRAAFPFTKSWDCPSFCFFIAKIKLLCYIILAGTVPALSSMPRQPRQLQIGTIYHIVNRGVEKRDIFLKNQDYSRFVLGLYLFNDENVVNVWESIQKAGTVPAGWKQLWAIERKPLIKLLAFALMPNHYHLIVQEIQKGGLSAFMRKLGGYASYFNKQYERVGSLFQSRYKVVEVTTDAQLMNVFVYVHTNPLELIEKKWKDMHVHDFENAMRFLRSYRWSSYLDYCNKSNFPSVTDREFYLDLYGGAKECEDIIKDWILFKAEKFERGDEIIE